MRTTTLLLLLLLLLLINAWIVLKAVLCLIDRVAGQGQADLDLGTRVSYIQGAEWLEVARCNPLLDPLLE